MNEFIVRRQLINGLPGHGFAGLSLQITQHDCASIFVRQSAKFLIQERLEIVAGFSFGDRGLRHLGHLPLSRHPFRRGCPRFESGLMRDAV